MPTSHDGSEGVAKASTGSKTNAKATGRMWLVRLDEVSLGSIECAGVQLKFRHILPVLGAHLESRLFAGGTLRQRGPAVNVNHVLTELAALVESGRRINLGGT